MGYATRNNEILLVPFHHDPFCGMLHWGVGRSRGAARSLFPAWVSPCCNSCG